jgi:hypothetical protein
MVVFPSVCLVFLAESQIQLESILRSYCTDGQVGIMTIFGRTARHIQHNPIEPVADGPKSLTGARKGVIQREIVGFCKGFKNNRSAENKASKLPKQQEKTGQLRDQARSGRASKKVKKLKQSRHSAESLYKGFSDVWVERKGMRAVVHDQEEKKRNQIEINRIQEGIDHLQEPVGQVEGKETDGKNSREYWAPKPWRQLDQRNRSAVSRSLRSLLMPDESTAYLMNELKSLHPEQRISLLKACAEEFTSVVKQVLKDPVIAAKLNVALLWLDVESASELWLSLNLKHHQWDGLARDLNTLLPHGEKYKGGVMPCTDTLIRWLEKQGARLQFKHDEPLQKMLQVDVISFLSDDSGEEDECKDSLSVQNLGGKTILAPLRSPKAHMLFGCA